MTAAAIATNAASRPSDCSRHTRYSSSRIAAWRTGAVRSGQRYTPGARPPTSCTTTQCGRPIPRTATLMLVRSRSSGRPRLASIRRWEPRAAMTLSTGGPATPGSRTGRPRSHAGPSRSLSPARWAAVTRGNSSGAESTSPRAAGPAGSRAGGASSRATTATGNSCTRSAPVSAATSASGKRV